MLSFFSHVQLFATRWTLARQAPLSTEFSRQEYWSGLPFPSPGDLPNPGTESKSPGSSVLQADSLKKGKNAIQTDLGETVTEMMAVLLQDEQRQGQEWKPMCHQEHSAILISSYDWALWRSA